MPTKLNKFGQQQPYVPAGHGDASGEYANQSVGSNKHYTSPTDVSKQLPYKIDNTLKHNGIDTSQMTNEEKENKYNEIGGDNNWANKAYPDIDLPHWFLDKNLDDAKLYAYKVGDKKIIKETEKAVCIKVYSDFGNFSFWCPKSVLNGTYKQNENEKITIIQINGKKYAKEFLMKNEKQLAKLGLTAEEVARM